MKIGISTSVIQRGQTGISNYLFGLLKGLKEQPHNHQFTLFVLKEDLPLFDFVRDGMEIVTVPERYRPPVNDIAWHQFQLPRLIKEHNIQVVHVPSYRRMLWQRPCALVATIHDVAPFRVAEKYDQLRMFYGKVMARRLAHRQDEIITVSHNSARDISQFFHVDSSRLNVIHNGIDHERFSPMDQERAKASAVTEFGITEPFFLYVARLEHPAKNHVRLIQAFNRFKEASRSNWQLVFVGKDWNGAAEIHNECARSPFYEDIHPLGFLAEDRLTLIYRAANVFVFPSLYEGFGLPPIEAMACGCPTICSPCGSLAEVVGDAAPLADPTDVEAWATEMALMATDDTYRSACRDAGLKQAMKFRWDFTAKSTLEVYEEAASRQASRR